MHRSAGAVTVAGARNLRDMKNALFSSTDAYTIVPSGH